MTACPISSGYLRTIPSQFASLTSFKVHYLEMGEGDPLILIHGGGMWLYSFRHNFRDLAGFFHVYALDMPGYGYTVPLGDTVSYGLDPAADTLLEFMNERNIERASLLGHSWGGGWVLRFASKYPERVERLILIDSSGFNVPDVLEWELMKYPLIGELLMNFVTVGTVKKRLERSFFHRHMVSLAMAEEVHLPLTFPHNRKAQLQIARNQDWKLTESSLQEIRHPSLVIWGDHDAYLDAELLHRFQGCLPNARTFLFKQCGHSPHEEYPQDVNALITAYLKTKDRLIRGAEPI